MIAITYTAEIYSAAAQLAQDLQLPLISQIDNSYPYLLIQSEEHLALWDTSNLLGKPMFVDFPQHIKQRFGVRSQIAKAVGLKSDFKPSVIDATAGLGQDAFVLASLGCKLTLLERSPIVAALLQDGMQRCAEALSWQLKQTDALQYLQSLAVADYPDVIYLDPMYPSRTKSALNKKEMRMLRAIVGDDGDTALLLEIARQRCHKRVVVKRPRLAPAIGEQKPSLVYMGSSVRFDVYL